MLLQSAMATHSVQALIAKPAAPYWRTAAVQSILPVRLWSTTDRLCL